MPKKIWDVDKKKAKAFEKGFNKGGPSASEMLGNLKKSLSRASSVLMPKDKAAKKVFR